MAVIAESSAPSASPRDRESSGSMLAVAVACLGGLAVTLDSTLVNAVFPAMLASLDREVSSVAWIVNGSNLTLALGLILAGRVTDAYGRLRIYTIGMIAFGSLSLMCALFPYYLTLVGIRIVLGLAAALLMVCSLALITDAVPPARRPAAMGLYGALSGLASVAGPALGALVLKYVHWRWAFLINVPICLVGVPLALRMLRVGADRPGGDVNWRSGAIGGGALAGLVFALSSGPKDGWSSPATAAGLVVAVLGGAYLLRAEAAGSNPLFPRSLRHASYVHPLLGVFVLTFAMGASLLAIPLFVTEVMGHSFVQGGLVLAVPALAGIPAALLSGRLGGRWGYRLPGGIGMTAAGLALLAMAAWQVHAGPVEVLLVAAIVGIGLGMGIPAMAGDALHQAGDEHAGAASGWYQTFRQIGLMLGVMAFAVLVSTAGDSERARDWLRGRLAEVEATDREALAAFDRLRACPSRTCVEEGLGLLDEDGQLEAVLPLVRESLRLRSATSFQRAFRWCGALCLAVFAAWLAMIPLARRSAVSQR